MNDTRSKRSARTPGVSAGSASGHSRLCARGSVGRGAGEGVVGQVGEDQRRVEVVQHLGQQLGRVGGVDQRDRHAGQHAGQPDHQVVGRAGGDDRPAGAARRGRARAAAGPARGAPQRVRQRELLVEGADAQVGPLGGARQEQLGQVLDHAWSFRVCGRRWSGGSGQRPHLPGALHLGRGRPGVERRGGEGQAGLDRPGQFRVASAAGRRRPRPAWSRSARGTASHTRPTALASAPDSGPGEHAQRRGRLAAGRRASRCRWPPPGWMPTGAKPEISRASSAASRRSAASARLRPGADRGALDPGDGRHGEPADPVERPVDRAEPVVADVGGLVREPGQEAAHRPRAERAVGAGDHGDADRGIRVDPVAGGRQRGGAVLVEGVAGPRRRSA